MRRSMAEVIARLGDEGLAPAGAAAAARDALSRELADHLPWYLRAAVGVGAWAATTFLLSAIFAIAGLRDELAWIVLGVLFMVAAVYLRRDARTEFMRWAAVAIALAGQVLVTMGTGGASNSEELAAGVCLVSAIALIRFVNDGVLRFLSTLAAGAATFVLFVLARIPQGFDAALIVTLIAAAWVWRGRLRERSDAAAEMLEPVGYALVSVLFGALLARTFVTGAEAGLIGEMNRDAGFVAGVGREIGSEIGAFGPLATIACTVALIVLAWKVLDEHGVSLSTPASFAALGGAAILGAGTLESPGIVAGVAALMLAFDRRDRVLLGMSVVFLLVFGSFYYYSLHLTLLEKSGVLLGSAALLFAVRSRLVRA